MVENPLSRHAEDQLRCRKGARAPQVHLGTTFEKMFFEKNFRFFSDFGFLMISSDFPWGHSKMDGLEFRGPQIHG